MLAVERLVDTENQSVWKRVQCIGATVNLGLAPSPVALAEGVACLTGPVTGGVSLSIDDLGIHFLKRDPGTGYHQPRGVLLLYGNGVAANYSRVEVDSGEVRPALLAMMGITQTTLFR